MSRRLPILASAIAASIVIAVLIMALLWRPWDSGDGPASDLPDMTLEGVIALVSRAHTGCPDQPLLVLSADAAYEGDGIWRVTYRDYEWIVDESDRSVRTIGESLPCPGR